MYDRYAINAELQRRGITQTALARKLGCTSVLVSYVISGKRHNARVRRAVARAIGKPVATLWPDNTDTRAAA